MKTPVDASYLADAVLLLRYFEDRGEVRQAIPVIKKRGSRHERTVRAFKFTEEGIVVGEPLREFRGVLTGVPVREDHPPDQGREIVLSATAQADLRVLVLAPTSATRPWPGHSLMAPARIPLEFCQGLDGLIRSCAPAPRRCCCRRRPSLPPRGDALVAALREPAAVVRPAGAADDAARAPNRPAWTRRRGSWAT